MIGLSISGIELFTVNLLGLSAFCGLFIGAGRLFNYKRSFSFTEAFYSLAFGILSVSTLTALFMTGGVTILSVYLLMGAILYYQHRQQLLCPDQSLIYQSSNSVIIISIFIGLLFVYLWSFLSIGQFDDFPFHIPDGSSLSQNDYIINTMRSYYIAQTGEENYYHVLNQLDPAYHGTKPYHYLEFWTTVFTSYCMSGLVAVHFKLVVVPLYYLTAFVGVLALMERYLMVRWTYVCLAMILMFCAGLYLPFYRGILNDFSLPIFSYRFKMAPYYLFMFACLIEYGRGNYRGSIWALLGLCVATIVAVPAVVGGVALFIVYRLITKDKSALSLILQLFVGCAAIVLFYSITGSQELNIRPNAGTSELMNNLGSLFFDDLPVKFATIFKTLLEELVIYIPIIVIGMAVLRSSKIREFDYRGLAVLVGGILFSGACAYALFYDQKDGAQIFYNVANPLLNVILIWGIIKLMSYDHNWTKEALNFRNGYVLSSACIFVLLISLQLHKAIKRNVVPAAWSAPSYSDQYLNEIKSYVLSDDHITIGAAIKGGQDYTSSYSWQTAAYTLGYYLAFMENGAIAIQISDYDIPNDDGQDLIDRESSLFYRYVEGQKAAGAFEGVAGSQLQFIETYDLDFIIVSKNGNMPTEINDIAKNVIIDPISGERFIILDPSKIKNRSAAH